MLKRLTLMTILLIVGVSAAFAQDSTQQPAPAATTEDQACLMKGGNLSDNGQCILSADVKMSVQYPLDLAQNPLVADTVDPFIDRTRMNFLSVLDQGFIPGPSQYELDVNYDEPQFSDDVVSLVFSIYVYTGGAHGNSTYQTFTFDLAAGEIVTLDDVFLPDSNYLAEIDPLVEQSLKDQVGDMIDPDWLKQGTGENAENYRNFSLSSDSITFYFDQYQVAPGAAGTLSVSIPLSQLSDVLAPEYVP